MYDHAAAWSYIFWRLKPNKPPVLPGEIKTLVYEKITSDDRMVKVWRPHYQESKEVINMEKNTVNHSAHSTWRCQYHIVLTLSTIINIYQQK